MFQIVTGFLSVSIPSFGFGEDPAEGGKVHKQPIGSNIHQSRPNSSSSDFDRIKEMFDKSGINIDRSWVSDSTDCEQLCL